MTEFEWVRELNEGVKKVYSDMEEAGLPAPEFIETPNTVKLILRNNIDERLAYRNKASNEANRDANEANRDAIEDQILCLLRNDPKITQVNLAEKIGVSRATVQRTMKSMVADGTITRIGATRGHWKINE